MVSSFIDRNLEVTPVIFRKWKASFSGDNFAGDIIALFPTIPDDVLGSRCLSYEHVGQHGGADLRGVISRTVPAKPVEYAGLRRELERVGYRLRVVKRATYQMREELVRNLARTR